MATIVRVVANTLWYILNTLPFFIIAVAGGGVRVGTLVLAALRDVSHDLHWFIMAIVAHTAATKP